MGMDYKRLENESDEELIFRICSLKTTETWQDIANGLNKEMNTEYTESKFRKQFQAFQRMFESVKHKIVDSNEHLIELEKKQDDLYKQQVKTSDKLREYKVILRDESRVENMMDVIKSEISKLETIQFSQRKIKTSTDTEAVNLIGDWHIGAKIDNYFGKYNMAISKDRVEKMLNDNLAYVDKFEIGTLHVVNLGDMIENGAIHISTRVMQEEDSIRQIMYVSELLAMYLTKLSEVTNVKYYSTLDNHSRSNAKFSDSIAKESFVYLIDWYLKERLKSNNSVEFMENMIDDSIGYFECSNRKIMFTHGNFGKMNTSIQDLALGTGIIPDYVMMGHYHAPKMKDFHGKKLVVNGCLSGVSQYALDNRLFGQPCQSLIVFDDENEMNIQIKF